MKLGALSGLPRSRRIFFRLSGFPSSGIVTDIPLVLKTAQAAKSLADLSRVPARAAS